MKTILILSITLSFVLLWATAFQAIWNWHIVQWQHTINMPFTIAFILAWMFSYVIEEDCEPKENPYAFIIARLLKPLAVLLIAYVLS